MHRLKTPLCCLLFVGLLFVAACSSETENQPTQGTGVTVFEGARLIVGDGSAPIEDSAFIVENNSFTGVGRRGELQVPSGAVRVDLTGKTVMPAIIDLHTHPATDVREGLVDQLQHQAYFGVAAILSMGRDQGDVPYEVRENPIPGAALFRTAGQGITMPEPGRSDIPYWITNEAEARSAVQELAAKEVNVVKIWVDDRGGTVEKLTPALYGAIIDEANKKGLRVAAHIRHLEDAKGLLRAGLHIFAHGVRDRDFDDEFLALLEQRPNVAQIPNLPPRGVAQDLAWISDAYPPEEFQRMQEAAANQQERPDDPFAIQAGNLSRLNAAGISIGMGTDSGTGWGVHVEMEDMVAAGMTPAEVIAAATGTSAEILGLTDHGTVEAGKSASFIVLDANPLDGITNTRRIAEVYLRGTKVDRTALSTRWTGPTS